MQIIRKQSKTVKNAMHQALDNNDDEDESDTDDNDD